MTLEGKTPVKVAHSRLLALLAGALALVVLLPVLAALGAYAVPAVRVRQGGMAQAPFDRPGPTPSYAAGWWQRYVNEADGYAVALPPDWHVLPFGPDAPLDGQLLAWACEQVEAGQGLWLAAAPAAGSGDATTVNIVRQPLPAEGGVDAFSRANIQALLVAGRASVVGREWLDLSDGRALRVTYRVPARSGEGEFAMTQVYLVNGVDGYVLTAVTPEAQAEANAPVFDGIVRSLRWLA